MDKEKLLKAGMWLSVTVLIIAVCLLPVLFFCAYKGIKSLLDAIFS